jgi:hypothetical protein
LGSRIAAAVSSGTVLIAGVALLAKVVCRGCRGAAAVADRAPVIVGYVLLRWFR